MKTFPLYSDSTRLSVLFISLFKVLPMMVGWAQEKEDVKEETIEEILSKVTIDTFQIRATPYEKELVNGVWKDEDKQIDYYNDITIYEIKKKESGQPSAMMTGPKPVIFMLPGGGFFGYSPSDMIGFRDKLSYINLGSKLADSNSAEVILIYYHTKPKNSSDSMFMVNMAFPFIPSQCNWTSNQVTIATSLNIDTLEWEFNCGYIYSSPIQTWSGNNLYSEVTVMANAPNQGCTNVRVRPRNGCATGSWRTQNLSLQNCGGGFMMMLYPNPSSTNLQIELKNEEDKASLEQTYSLMVVDIQGQPVVSTNIQYGKANIDVSKLKEGQYKVIVWINEVPLSSTFNISR